MTEPSAPRIRQRGMTLVGAIFLLAIAAGIGLIAMQAVPAYLEFRSAKQAIFKAKAEGQTPREIRNKFDKMATVQYITAIEGKDLDISKDTGSLEVSFEYRKKIPLFGPASLIFDFAASTLPSTGGK